MKKTGISLIVIGLLFTIFTEFGLFTKKKVMEIGNIEIKTSESNRTNWSSYLSLGIIVAGVVFYLYGVKQPK